MQLFVYGSLLRGMSLSSHMEGARFLGPAFVQADLFFLGFYPGIIPGTQTVLGELYDVPPAILPNIDKVEDYYENDPENSIYLRKPIEAYLFSNGNKIEAFAYYYNRESEGKPRIPCGDYRRFMHMQKADWAWLIGYGTYLSSERIISKAGPVSESMLVQIHGFERVFNVKTGKNGFAHANLNFTGKDQFLKAIAWKLTRQQLEKLDIEENVPHLYHRLSIPFRNRCGELEIAQTYIANINQIGQNLYPEPQYLEILKKGMREHGIY